jgi:hypothetical protein
MTKKISDGEFHGVTALTGAERYSHLVRQVADFQAVWGLRSLSGWVSMGDDTGERLFPIWPHERYTQVFISGDWSDTKPTAIELDDWIETWLPNMVADGVQLAVFPVVTKTECGVVVPAAQLLRDLQEELKKYE